MTEVPAEASAAIVYETERMFHIVNWVKTIEPLVLYKTRYASNNTQV